MGAPYARGDDQIAAAVTRQAPRFRHDHSVVGVFFSPDGKLLLGETGDESASSSRIWDTTTGKLASQFRETLGRHPRFSPDGKWLVDIAITGAPRLWSVKTGKLVRTWNKDAKPESKDGVVALSTSFTRDGKILVVHGKQNDRDSIRRFDLNEGTEFRRCEKPDEAGHELAMSPDGKMLVVHDVRDNTAFLLDLDTGKRLRTLEKKLGTNVFGMAFSPDGKTLVGVVDQNTLFTWNVSTGKLVRRLDNGRAGFFGIRADPFSPDSKLFAVNDADDRNVLVHEAATGKLLLSVSNGRGEHCYNLFSPDNRLLATLSDGGRTTCIWEVVSGKKLNQFAFKLERITSDAMAFSPDSTTFAFASGKFIELKDSGEVEIRKGK
jgi:WD40 repeat protein